MNEQEHPDPVVTAILGLLLPGAGHLYGGRFPKALFFFVLVTGTFVAGLVLSGFHAVSLKQQPYWFFGQVFAGLPAALSALLSPGWATVRIGPGLEAGTLYTTVAGLLNVLVVLDAAFPVESRLLLNAPEGDAALDHHAFYASLRGEGRGPAFHASFASFPAAVAVLKELSFVTTDPGDGAPGLPPGMQAGVFKRPSGAVLVLGGGLTGAQSAEATDLLGNRARRVRIDDGRGSETVRRKPWWRR